MFARILVAALAHEVVHTLSSSSIHMVSLFHDVKEGIDGGVGLSWHTRNPGALLERLSIPGGRQRLEASPAEGHLRGGKPSQGLRDLVVETHRGSRGAAGGPECATVRCRAWRWTGGSHSGAGLCIGAGRTVRMGRRHSPGGNVQASG